MINLVLGHSKIHDKPHECVICSNRFSSTYDLDCHFSYYHSTFKRFKCEYCDRVLYNYSGKLRHERLCVRKKIGIEQKSSINDPEKFQLKSQKIEQLPNESKTNLPQSLKQREVTEGGRIKFHIMDILSDIPHFDAKNQKATNS